MDVLEIIACVEEEARRFRALGLLPSELQADDLRKAELLEKAVEILRTLVDAVDEWTTVDRWTRVPKWARWAFRNIGTLLDSRTLRTAKTAPAKWHRLTK